MNEEEHGLPKTVKPWHPAGWGSKWSTGSRQRISMHKTTVDPVSWVEAIDGFREDLYSVPEVSDRLAASEKKYMEVVLRNGENHWVERFSEHENFPGFVHFFCERTGSKCLYELLVRCDEIVSMQWMPESHITEEPRPPFGFVAGASNKIEG